MSEFKADDFVMPRTEGGVSLCHSCRKNNLCRLGVTTEQVADDGRIEFDVECPPFYEAGPGVAHGGWTAEVMDETTGRVPLDGHGQMTVTGTLSVRYIKPVAIGLQLKAAAWLDRVEGKKWFVLGELRVASTSEVLASATGIMIAREPAAHFGEFKKWLGDQESDRPAAI